MGNNNKSQKELYTFRGQVYEVLDEYRKKGKLTQISREETWAIENQLAQDLRKIKKNHEIKDRNSRDLISRIELTSNFM